MAAKRRQYDPARDPLPRVWKRGWASQAQRRHFLAAPALQKFIGGMDYWTPPRGLKGAGHSIGQKLDQLPQRVKRSERRRYAGGTGAVTRKEAGVRGVRTKRSGK